MGYLKSFRTPVLVAASFMLLPSAASAQDNTLNAVDPVFNDTVATTGTDPLVNDVAPVPVREDDDDFPWGLLGLLGLAGLLGRKKKDDIHVDARNDRRNV